RGAAEQYAVRIEDPHLAVGIELAQDMAAIDANYPVESDGGAVGLQERDASAFADVQALPVVRPDTGRLLDRHRRAVLDDGRAAGANGPARGELARSDPGRRRHRRQSGMVSVSGMDGGIRGWSGRGPA